MSISSNRAKREIDELSKLRRITDLADSLRKRVGNQLPPVSIPSHDMYSKEGQNQRLAFLKEKLNISVSNLSGEIPFSNHEQLRGNIENYIGMTQVPTGIMGPVLINGTMAQGDYFVPLATSEGALVASYNRGAKACRQSGGISSICLIESVHRSPLFKFTDIIETGKFVIWVLEHLDEFRAIAKSSSRYAELQEVKTNIEGNQVILTFEYTTGDAAGQNMVTICTQAICEYIIEQCPIKPERWFVESNYSGDKKATAVALSYVRGKKVTSEAFIERDVVIKTLKSTPEKIHEYWESSTLSVIQSGAIGAQGHVANGLTALFLACGQDVACIAEASTGITRMEVNKDGDLYVAVTLPGLIVGTVGGGTGLPTQQECLGIMDCSGPGNARKFAEICSAVALCGELSIAAALSAGHFTRAHKELGRKK